MREYIVKCSDEFVKQMKDQGMTDEFELIRCKDCKWFSRTTLGMTYACWRGGEKVWGETGEHEGHHSCHRIESEDHYCGYAERRTE